MNDTFQEQERGFRHQTSLPASRAAHFAENRQALQPCLVHRAVQQELYHCIPLPSPECSLTCKQVKRILLTTKSLVCSKSICKIYPQDGKTQVLLSTDLVIYSPCWHHAQQLTPDTSLLHRCFSPPMANFPAPLLPTPPAHPTCRHPAPRQPGCRF